MASESKTEQKLIGAWGASGTNKLLEAFNEVLFEQQKDGWELVWLEIAPADHLTIIGWVERKRT